MFEGYLHDDKCPFPITTFVSANNMYLSNNSWKLSNTNNLPYYFADLFNPGDCMDAGFYIRKINSDWYVDTTNKSPKPGKLTVWTNAAGTLYIDGINYGSDFSDRAVSVGNYTVKIVGLQNSGLPDYNTTVYVPAQGYVLNAFR